MATLMLNPTTIDLGGGVMSFQWTVPGSALLLGAMLIIPALLFGLIAVVRRIDRAMQAMGAPLGASPVLRITPSLDRRG